MALPDSIPRVDTESLSEEGEYNPGRLNKYFVQLLVDGEHYLRFGGPEADTHRITLGGFIEECRNAGEQIIPEAEYKKHIKWAEKVGEAPYFPVRSGRYQAVGMGTASVLQESGVIRFLGENQEYGLEPNKEHLDAVSEHLPDWEIKLD